MNISAYVLVGVLAIAGCASPSPEPVLDGTPSENYPGDLIACQRLANQHRNVAEDAKHGAVYGAGTGAVIGGIAGGVGAMAQTKEQNYNMVFNLHERSRPPCRWLVKS